MNKPFEPFKMTHLSQYFHRKGFLAFFLMMSCWVAQAQNTFKPAIYQGDQGSLNYQILLPNDFSTGSQYPLVLFLHGIGERGEDNLRQLIHGSKLFTDSANSSRFPAIVIFPQCAADDYWANIEESFAIGEKSFSFHDSKAPGRSLSLVMDLLDSMQALGHVNPNRIYVGGLSMGGMGTFEILSRKPNLFAAAFPICGGGNPESAGKYALNTPLWVFHGAQDDVVYPHYSVDMVAALQNAGASPRFNLYKDANHNSWDMAFAEPDLLPWLFSQNKKK